MPAIIVKHYNHLNKAFPVWDTPQGKLVKSKDHYDRLMKENNMISYEESIERSKYNGQKPLVVSQKALDLVNEAKNRKDSKGRVRLDGKFGEELVKMGAIGKKIPNYMKLPQKYQEMGGFNT